MEQEQPIDAGSSSQHDDEHHEDNKSNIIIDRSLTYSPDKTDAEQPLASAGRKGKKKSVLKQKARHSFFSFSFILEYDAILYLYLSTCM
jgi:hypothetical protein